MAASQETLERLWVLLLDFHLKALTGADPVDPKLLAEARLFLKDNGVRVDLSNADHQLRDVKALREQLDASALPFAAVMGPLGARHDDEER